MFNTVYSKAVLTGLIKHGLSVDDVAEIIQRPVGLAAKVLRGKAGLTDKDLERIEDATGMTAGLLAVLSEDGPDETLLSLMEASAAARTPASKARARRFRAISKRNLSKNGEPHRLLAK